MCNLKQVFAIGRQKKIELLKVANITNLGEDYIQMEVMVHLHIRSVNETAKWFKYVCSSCGNEIEKVEDCFFCDNCNSMKPYPDKHFNISVLASDETGGIRIVLEDQQVRAILGKRVVQLLKECSGDEKFPNEVKKLINQKYTMKLIIKDVNVENKIQIYWATNICKGFIPPIQEVAENSNNPQQSNTELSRDSYHLDGMSQLNFQSPMTGKKPMQ